MDLTRLRPLFDAPTLAARIEELAAEIRASHPGGPLIVIGVLKGSFLFLADLVRALGDLDVEIELLGVRSYEGMESTGAVQITHDLRRSLEGRRCLIVEDIIDTGLTMRFLTQSLRLRLPESLQVVSLLDKPVRRLVPFDPDFVGFTIPNHFVVGYGLDLDEKYRHLPYIAVYNAD
jgi:hypoxanthine phosphoribosyltransferase